MIRLQAVTRASGWTLNEDRILLPLTDEGATFKLFTDGGCFEWKSSRPEVVLQSGQLIFDTGYPIFVTSFVTSLLITHKSSKKARLLKEMID